VNGVRELDDLLVQLAGSIRSDPKPESPLLVFHTGDKMITGVVPVFIHMSGGKFIAYVADTGGKFIARVASTSSKFIADVNDTGDKKSEKYLSSPLPLNTSSPNTQCCGSGSD